VDLIDTLVSVDLVLIFLVGMFDLTDLAIFVEEVA
jgi:hypothetical protein